jgi:uncharacterized protein YlxW (UPF0749 family)
MFTTDRYRMLKKIALLEIITTVPTWAEEDSYKAQRGMRQLCAVMAVAFLEEALKELQAEVRRLEQKVEELEGSGEAC